MTRLWLAKRQRQAGNGLLARLSPKAKRQPGAGPPFVKLLFRQAQMRFFVMT
jgi:hypothetical protein